MSDEPELQRRNIKHAERAEDVDGFTPVYKRRTTKVFRACRPPSMTLKENRLVTYGINANGAQQVVRYNQDALVEWAGLGGVLARASIFRLRLSLALQAFVLILVAGITCAAMRFIMHASGKQSQDGDEMKYWKMQVQPLVELATYINALVAFIFGLFISLSIQRWWAMRSQHVFGVSKTIQNLVFSLAGCLTEPKYNEVRDQILRHSLLSLRLVFLCARGGGALEEEDIRTLTSDGLCTPSEVEELLAAKPKFEVQRAMGTFDFDLAAIPWVWTGRQIHLLFKAGAFAPPVMALLHGLCKEAQLAIESVKMQLNSQLPFAYVHLISTLVQGSVLFGAVRCGIFIALADTALAQVCNVLSSGSIAIIYLGLLSMSAVIADPFGDDVIDIPASQLERQVWKSLQLIDILREPPWSPGPEVLNKKEEAKKEEAKKPGGDDGGD